MVWQPRTGFRSGADAVLLAAAVPALPGQQVLELGCGAGAAALCLCARVPGATVTGLELQPAYAALARRNAAENHAALTVFDGDVAAPPASVRAQSFDHVMMNPPYFRREPGGQAQDAGRETALGEGQPLAVWIATAIRRLRAEGWLTLFHRAERLADVLAALDGLMGSLRIRPLAPRSGRDALSVIVQARKGGRAPLRLLAPLVLHRGDHHPGDTPHFTEMAAAILHDGAVLPMDG